MLPRTPAELADVVRATPRLLVVGAGTKPRLGRVSEDVPTVSTRGLSGMVEYEPSEYTFTALAGTPVAEIAAALAAHGQYLPFDPLLVEAGATLGGTLASGLNGPGRFRYGGLRDFILGVRFVDGLGRLLRLGGKVVKNAAGFDVPKFLVGSLGRYGAMAELTFKVFPRAPEFRTVRWPVADPAQAAAVLMGAANTRWELDALDFSRTDGAVYARIGGPAAALDALTAEMIARWPGGALVAPDAAELLWRSAREFAWAPAGGILLKVVMTPQQLPEICRAVSFAGLHVSAGGNVAYVACDTVPPGLSTFAVLTLRGDAPLFPGRPPVEMPAVKAALDPVHRFPSLLES